MGAGKGEKEMELGLVSPRRQPSSQGGARAQAQPQLEVLEVRALGVWGRM